MAVGYYAARREKMLREIHEEFTAADIPYLIFKGNEVAKYYPEPSLRQMGDTDILVHLRDKEKADEALRRIGVERESSSADEWFYRKNDLNWNCTTDCCTTAISIVMN